MPRYIDADEVRKRLFAYYNCVNENATKDNYCGDTLMDYEIAQMIEDCIEETPTADVQEVRRGYWIPSPDGINPIRCSECNMPAPFAAEENEFGDFGIRRYPSSYCPKCGAKMDGGDM